MLSYFYKKTEKSSRQQLKEDFGDFPPAPLTHSDLSAAFQLVRVRAVGELGHLYLQWMGVFKAFKDEPSSISLEGRERLAVLLPNVAGLTNVPSSDAPALQKRTLRLPRHFLAALLALRAWRRAGFYGYFNPLVVHDRQLVVQQRACRRPQGLASIISHEHMHYLQHLNGKFSGKAIPGAHLFLNEEDLTNRKILYLLEQKEVEARLHEVVLSAYRSGLPLPLTAQGFLELLHACVELQVTLNVFWELVGKDVNDVDKTFHMRDVEIATEIETVLLYAKNAESAYRFTTEVLSVMYGNLLQYYGNKPASVAFLSQISRPNLYDELYDPRRT